MAALEALTRELHLQTAVQFPGGRSEPFALHAASESLALSSVAEALPTVLIEALAMNLPIVATDCPAGRARYCRTELTASWCPLETAVAWQRPSLQTLQ